MPVPHKFPRDKRYTDTATEFINFSDGELAGTGSWAQGPTPDGEGEFSFLPQPNPGVPMPAPTTPDPRLYGTDAGSNTVEKISATVKDALHKG